MRQIIARLWPVSTICLLMFTGLFLGISAASESGEKVAGKEGHSNYVAHIKVGSKESTVTVAEDGHVIPEKKKK